MAADCAPPGSVGYADASTHFVGCYANDDKSSGGRKGGTQKESPIGYHKPMNFDECKARAIAGGMAGFGFENPQEYSAKGVSNCAVLSKYDLLSMQQGVTGMVRDQNCETEEGPNGRKLGGAGHLATYAFSSSSHTKLDSHPYLLGGSDADFENRWMWMFGRDTGLQFWPPALIESKGGWLVQGSGPEGIVPCSPVSRNPSVSGCMPRRTNCSHTCFGAVPRPLWLSRAAVSWSM